MFQKKWDEREFYGGVGAGGLLAKYLAILVALCYNDGVRYVPLATLFFLASCSQVVDTVEFKSGAGSLRDIATKKESEILWTHTIEGERLSQNLSQSPFVSDDATLSPESLSVCLAGSPVYPTLPRFGSLDNSDVSQELCLFIDGLFRTLQQWGLQNIPLTDNALFSLVLFKHDVESLWQSRFGEEFPAALSAPPTTQNQENTTSPEQSTSASKDVTDKTYSKEEVVPPSLDNNDAAPKESPPAATVPVAPKEDAPATLQSKKSPSSQDAPCLFTAYLTGRPFFDATAILVPLRLFNKTGYLDIEVHLCAADNSFKVAQISLVNEE